MSSLTAAQAFAIAQEMLDLTARALLDGDVDAFCRRVQVPFRTESFDAAQVFETQEELSQAFAQVHRTYRENGITAMHRRLFSAEFKGAEEIHYSYETRLLRGDILAEAAYPNYAVMHRIDGVWKLVSSQHALDNPPGARLSCGNRRKDTLTSKDSETKERPSDG